MHKIRKRQYFEIKCPSCEHAFWTENIFNYFRTESIKCSECGYILNKGTSGMHEQVLLYLKSRAIPRAIKLVQFANPASHAKAKLYVEKIARDNNIKINTDVTVYVNFFVRLIISGLIGFAIVGIGSIYFPNLQKIAAPVVSSGDFSIEADKFNTIKTGGEQEYGVVMFVYDTDSEGVSHDITKKTFYTASVMYSLIVFLILYILSFIKYIRRLKKAAEGVFELE